MPGVAKGEAGWHNASMPDFETTKSSTKRAVLGVGGRFHSDRLAKALDSLGFQTLLYTTFPASRFPILDSKSVRSFIIPEIIFRIGRKLFNEELAARFKMKKFGAWLSTRLSENSVPDLFVGWSSFSLESLRKHPARVNVLSRDSTHIQFQSKALSEEYSRLNLPYTPNTATEQRELEEYSLADQIWVLSHFAKKTFVERGISPAKIRVIPLGVDCSVFKPRADLKVQGNLKVVYFGALSVRKGVKYFVDLAAQLQGTGIEFYLIGDWEAGLREKLNLTTNVQEFPSQKHTELSLLLQKMDVFFFPTIEDGFGQTVIQAMAAGIVPIVTESCGALDVIRDGQNGYVVPVRNTERAAQLLKEFQSSPLKILELKKEAIASSGDFTWDRFRENVSAAVKEIFPIQSI